MCTVIMNGKRGKQIYGHRDALKKQSRSDPDWEGGLGLFIKWNNQVDFYEWLRSGLDVHAFSLFSLWQRFR